MKQEKKPFTAHCEADDCTSTVTVKGGSFLAVGVRMDQTGWVPAPGFMRFYCPDHKGE